MHRDVCWYAVLSLLRYVDFSEGRNLKGVLNLKIITYLYFCFLLNGEGIISSGMLMKLPHKPCPLRSSDGIEKWHH